MAQFAPTRFSSAIRRKQETPPEFLQRVLDLEAQYGGARRKGRKTNSKAKKGVTAASLCTIFFVTFFALVAL